MSDEQGSSPKTLTIVGVVAILLLGALVYLGGNDQTPLLRSATGMKGAVSWLQANGRPARVFHGQTYLVRKSVGLRILPLYDTDLRRRRKKVEKQDELIRQTSEYDLSRWVFRAKIASARSMVVLPKWRSGVRLLKVAHKDLLIPLLDVERLLSQMDLSGVWLRRDMSGASEKVVTVGKTSARTWIAHRQTVSAGNCRPLIGTVQNMLLGDCPVPSRWLRRNGPRRFLLLSDPDLIANHGLSPARNGQAFLSIVNAHAGKGAIVLDMSTESKTREIDPLKQQHERSWDDFARMFRWPFSVIWVAFGAVALLVFWRAVTRYGPVARVYDDEPQAAKTVSIDAKARLLRLAHHDDALLRSHIQARLADLVADLLGPHRQPGRDPLSVLLPIVQRADPDLARELAQTADLKHPISDVLGRLDRFENCHDRIRDEFGRAATAG